MLNIGRISKMGDFTKVPALCGIVTIKLDGASKDSLVTITYRNTNKKRVKIYGINSILPYGVPYAIFECTDAEYKKPDDKFDYIPVFMLADIEGYYSRKCPSCNKYFRTKTTTVKMCPYCRIVNQAHFFITDEQLNYIKDYTKIYINAVNTKQNVVFDLDLIKEMENSAKPEYNFFEKKQQTTFTCDKCGLETNIMGLYGYCPNCGQRNSLKVLENQLEQLQKRVDVTRYTTSEREERNGEWREITKQCVSYFEAFARDMIFETKIIVPTLPKRIKILGKISFHNPIRANEILEKCFGIDLLDGIDKKNQRFIEKRFLRRHIYEHRGGIVDQKYIDKTKEKSLKAGQLLRETRSNLSTLINLVKKMAINLDKDFHSFAIEDRDDG